LITAKSHLDLVSVPPSPWVATHAKSFRPQARVLDYACGSGRHTLWLAQQGFELVAIDRDQAALNQIQEKAENIPSGSIKTICLDLEGELWNLESLGQFDAIIVTNYLYRPHLHKLPKLLNKNGFLVYETFAVGNEAYGKPSNPDFLLKPNELLSFAQNMKILAFEDLIVQIPKPACVQRLCAVPLQSKT
jgi:SAM-dependent methyltransferase